jgi:hypothetical protein
MDAQDSMGQRAATTIWGQDKGLIKTKNKEKTKIEKVKRQDKIKKTRTK